MPLGTAQSVICLIKGTLWKMFFSVNWILL